ncbi:CBS domain-containing protein [Streptomyces sp. NPDC046685]|uniref:CBS domain-containing protein n=1 Tax=Streptomyces sp. NPDC046685 TaxID=3157202 RepID=UPI0033F1EA9F
MRACDLAEPYLSVSKDADASEAVRLLVEHALPGLLVVDTAGRPYAIVPACDVVGALVPRYVQEDPVLAGVMDEPHADHLFRALAGKKLSDCLPVGKPFLPTAAPDRTAMGIAELMVHTRSPLIAVVEGPAEGPVRLLGVVTAAHLLERLLQA